MPHLYTCRQCRTQAPESRDQEADAEVDRQEHRDRVHGGHAPIDGDGIRRVHSDRRGDGFFPRHTAFAGLVMLALLLANCWGR